MCLGPFGREEWTAENAENNRETTETRVTAEEAAETILAQRRRGAENSKEDGESVVVVASSVLTPVSVVCRSLRSLRPPRETRSLTVSAVPWTLDIRH